MIKPEGKIVEWYSRWTGSLKQFFEQIQWENALGFPEITDANECDGELHWRLKTLFPMI